MKSANQMKRYRMWAVLLALFAMASAAGCNYRGNKSGIHWFLDMHDGLFVEAQEEDYTTLGDAKGAGWERGMDEHDAFGGPGSGIRVPPQGSVPRGQNPYPYAAGDFEGSKALENPLPNTAAVLERGQNRYNTYCAPCHGFAGLGDGAVTPRFDNIPAVVSPTIQGWSDGEIFHIITAGRARMKPYAASIPVNDRWTIVRYVRLLQAHQRQQPGGAPATTGNNN